MVINMNKHANEKEVKPHDHGKVLELVERGMPGKDKLTELSDLFKLFGDKTRIKILYSLFESEMCVCAISELLDMSQSAISHQLKVLRDGNLITNRRDGKTIYYRLADDHVRTIIGQGYEHITEGE